MKNEESLFQLIHHARVDFANRYGKYPEKIFMHPYLIVLLQEELCKLPYIMPEVDYHQIKQIHGMDIVEIPVKFVYLDKEIEPLPMSFGL